MKIADCMNDEVTTCRLDQTLADAAALFWDRDVGVLPVVDATGRVVGMLTDRDVCIGAYFRGKSLSELPVAEAMSRTVATCATKDEVDVVAKTMAEAGVRRLPVLDETGKLRGIVGLTDLARVATAKKAPAKTAKVVAEVLSAFVASADAAPAELVPAAKAPAKKKAAKKSTRKAPAPAKPKAKAKTSKASRKSS